jgi:hypothetical protein
VSKQANKETSKYFPLMLSARWRKHKTRRTPRAQTNLGVIFIFALQPRYAGNNISNYTKRSQQCFSVCLYLSEKAAAALLALLFRPELYIWLVVVAAAQNDTKPHA